jgi:outer membrane protein insertion porin family
MSRRSNSTRTPRIQHAVIARSEPPSERGMMSYTSGTRYPRLTLQACLFACLFLMSVQALESQQSHDSHTTQSFIDRLEIAGNRRVERATIMAHIVSRPGDTYDSAVVQRDARSLRDTGYFDEVRLRVEDDPDAPKGKIVAFDVKERPVIRRIEYLGIKSISEADIENAYKENKITLSVESWFDPEKMTRAAKVIEELLATHGHPSAVVKPTYERIVSSNAVAILFTIDEGPKAQPSPNSH